MAAAEYYEQQGGTASVFINDDGMQAIEPELAEARMQYYRENGIGYVARLPQHKSRPVKKKSSWSSWKDDFVVENKHPEVDEDLSPSQALANKIGFKRNGKFKKASNMNYGLEFSERVEKEFSRLLQLAVVERGISEDEFTIEEEDELSRHALDNMLAFDEGRTCKRPASLEACLLNSVRG
jgi:hypothetical protein